MFVPEWPSSEEDDKETHSNTCSATETGTDTLAEEMNGDHINNLNANNDSSSNQTNDDAIELTHDEATGTASVSSGDDEGEGDAMEQCAMWSASFPEQDQGNGSYETSAENNTNNVLGSFGGGDIWSTEAFAFESPLKDLLDSNNFSLADLLAQDELLQELRGCEARLVDYFSKPEVVAGLVECLICEVPYINQDKGKERWCKEETERRKLMAEEKQWQEKSGKTAPNENGNNEDDVRVRASSITNDNPNIEASWNSPGKNQSIIPNNQETASDQRSPEEEYDLRYIRYPYMACEVLCSDVGSTLDVLVNGYEDFIDDDEDSLLNDTVGEVRMREIKTEEIYDSTDVYLDDEPNGGLLSGPSMIPDEQVQLPQTLDPPPTPRNTRTPQRRILDLLFSIIIDTPPSSLDDRRAGYFEKILVMLFRKYSQVMSDYMNTSLVITAKSTDMTQRTESLCHNCRQQSTHVSLIPSMDSLGSESDGRILPSSFNQISTTLPLSYFLSYKAPPMLMCALFDHLHSHSIMHIVHRLLMPRQQQNAKEVKTVESGNVNDVDSDNPNSAINDQFMNAINQMNQNANCIDDEADDDDDLEDEMNHLFQCDWSEQPSHALELLLSRLEGHTEPFLLKYKFPVGYNASHLKNGSDNPPSEAESYDAKLSCAQHASEILISIIQNSPLDSPVMISLSSDPLLSRIIKLTTLSGSNEVTSFVPHESMMTCAMTVLENLILQLGGYGAVSLPSAAVRSHLSSSPTPAKETDKSFIITEIGPHTPATSPSPPVSSSSIATTADLIIHLPALLEELSSLLVHPVTKTWTTPTQYTNFQPRHILGISRLRILRLIESLVLLGNPTTDLLLQQSDCLECCLDLFWKFEWCSMLHQSVANFLVQVFEAGNHRAGLQDYFIIRCQILEKLMDSFSDSSFFGDEKLKVTENGSNDAAKVESATQFGDDIVMAMKSMIKDHATSSVESLDGSESESSNDRQVDLDDGDAVAHVSEDDIESAMEKEEQENQATNGRSNLPSATGNTNEANAEARALAASATSDHPISQQFPFRRGNMGHVIIICQAIVNACTASSQTSDQSNPTDEPKVDQALHDDTAIRNLSSTADFDSSAVQCITDDSVVSIKRRDLSPARIGDEHMSPIAKIPLSPIEIENLAQSPLASKVGEDLKQLPHIASIIREHPFYDRWAAFISSTLAAAMIAQSKPLGGQYTAKDSGASVSSDSKNRFVGVIDDDSDNNFLGVDNGVFGELTMDENDLDIAAQMMESLNLTSSNTADAGSEEPLPIGHNRRNRVIGGGMLVGCQESLNGQERNIGNFGSLIHSSTNAIGSKEYIYDDPLGQMRPFDNDDSSDEDDTHFTATISKESVDSNSGRINRSCSTDEEDDEDSPRVMDLFTGNFADNNVAGNPFTNDSRTQEDNTDEGWANFANFEDAFTLDDATATTTESPS